MDSINDMVNYIKNILDFKGLSYFDDFEFKPFDDITSYLKNLFDYENIKFDLFDDIYKYINELIDFENYDFEFINDYLNYIKSLFGYEEVKMDKNDVMLDNMYSSAFKATCYTKDEIPKDYLPYGLISDPKKYIQKVSEKINRIEWSIEIYNDCLKYIKNFGGAESESEWYNDFIVFTNLQISFYNNPKLIKENEEFDLITDYIHKHIRNLRSYVAKNAQLFLECLIYCLENYELFDKLSFKIIPELLICTGSEKSTYRDTSKNNLKLLTSNSYKHFNQEILWIFLDNCKSLNKKISSSASEFAVIYFMNSNKNNLNNLDINKLIEYLEYGLSVKNIEVKRSIKKIVISLPKMLNKEKITLFILETFKKPYILEIVKKEFPIIS